MSFPNNVRPLRTEIPTEQSISVNPTNPEWYKLPKRTIAEILADLSKPIPNKYLSRLKDKGNCLYIPWFNAVRLLDRVTGGHWEYAIANVTTTDNRIFITVRITIHAQEGEFSREAIGTELLKREVTDKETGEILEKELAFGDPSSNAESMALRRAAAKFGLALYLYDS